MSHQQSSFERSALRAAIAETSLGSSSAFQRQIINTIASSFDSIEALRAFSEILPKTDLGPTSDNFVRATLRVQQAFDVDLLDRWMICMRDLYDDFEGIKDKISDDDLLTFKSSIVLGLVTSAPTKDLALNREQQVALIRLTMVMSLAHTSLTFYPYDVLIETKRFAQKGAGLTAGMLTDWLAESIIESPHIHEQVIDLVRSGVMPTEAMISHIIEGKSTAVAEGAL